MFHILNEANGHKMAERDTFEQATVEAQRLADKHKQNYAIYQLSLCATISPTATDTDHER